MHVKIVRVSLWEKIKLHFLCFVYGVYLIIKRFVKWAWDPKKFFGMTQRDKPPLCLVDNSLGKHSYVKLKVMNKYIYSLFILFILFFSLNNSEFVN